MMETVNFQKYVDGITKSADEEIIEQARIVQGVFRLLGVDKGLSHYVRTEETYRAKCKGEPLVWSGPAWAGVPQH